MKTKTVRLDKVVNNFVDPDTGELLELSSNIKRHTIVVDDKETFAFQYASIIGVFKELHGNDIKVLTYCSLHAETNTNRIALTRPICDDITKKLNIPYQSIRNSLAKLVDKDILISLGSATYRISPKYYWRGNSTARLTTMKYILDVECPNC